jgi:hypothetical protein
MRVFPTFVSFTLEKYSFQFTVPDVNFKTDMYELHILNRFY